jgi:hypothetical protein
LTIVNKKLSKTLSVTATVNDLINQASDERNLAVLYSGKHSNTLFKALSHTHRLGCIRVTELGVHVACTCIASRQNLRILSCTTYIPCRFSSIALRQNRSRHIGRFVIT